MNQPQQTTYDDLVRLELDARLARVTITNPPHNAMTPETLRALWEAFVDLEAHRDLSVIVITGDGGVGAKFCPGADLDRLNDPRRSADGDLNADPRPFELPALITEHPAVTVAAMNGATAGAGLGVAMACDLRFMAAGAKLNSAFLDVGVAGDLGLIWSLTRKLGLARAAELMYLPGRITSDEALRLGLVHRVYADTEFEQCVEAEIARLTGARRDALVGMKRNLATAEVAALRPYLRDESELHLRLVDPIGRLGTTEGSTR